MRLRHFWPLVGFVVPTLVIGFGYVIPKSCIAGVNELTLGFLSSVLGACVTYWAGIRSVLRDRQQTTREVS
jgi:ABC-type Fe3+ transport system permease subunit